MGYGTCEETAVRVLAEEAPLYAGARLADCRDRGIPTSMDTEEEEAVDTVDTVDMVDRWTWWAWWTLWTPGIEP